jgi:hypothetical protein
VLLIHSAQSDRDREHNPALPSVRLTLSRTRKGDGYQGFVEGLLLKVGRRSEEIKDDNFSQRGLEKRGFCECKGVLGKAVAVQALTSLQTSSPASAKAPPGDAVAAYPTLDQYGAEV